MKYSIQPNLISKNSIQQNIFGKYHYQIIFLFVFIFSLLLYLKYIDKPTKEEKYKTLLNFYNKIYN
uniref:Uncharacterized protein n=1 Tax=viral metagenome TaxID=1070528 RepID=A0A6C0EHA6_9ZZZZ